jgi:DNA-binding MarR family transcriptional regulator
MAEWSFLTSHAKALLCIADDPGVRLRDIAATLGVTERSAFAIVSDLADAGYIVKEREGRRNRYTIQHHLPLRDQTARERTIGDLLKVLVGTTAAKRQRPGVSRRTKATGTRRAVSR